MSPVLASKLIPVSVIAGDIENPVIAVPVELMVYPAIADPTVATSKLEESVNAGGPYLTVKVYVAVAELVEFEPVIVYVVSVAAAVGTPEINPVVVSNERPADSAGVME